MKINKDFIQQIHNFWKIFQFFASSEESINYNDVNE